jgi:hypothetical protein
VDWSTLDPGKTQKTSFSRRWPWKLLYPWKYRRAVWYSPFPRTGGSSALSYHKTVTSTIPDCRTFTWKVSCWHSVLVSIATDWIIMQEFVLIILSDDYKSNEHNKHTYFVNCVLSFHNHGHHPLCWSPSNVCYIAVAIYNPFLSTFWSPSMTNRRCSKYTRSMLDFDQPSVWQSVT